MSLQHIFESFILKQVANGSPLRFLAALGLGGMVIGFLCVCILEAPSPNRPIPLYDNWLSRFQFVGRGMRGLIIIAFGGILLFSWFHFYWHRWGIPIWYSCELKDLLWSMIWSVQG